jgi:Flp pilus assembly protein TadD
MFRAGLFSVEMFNLKFDRKRQVWKLGERLHPALFAIALCPLAFFVASCAPRSQPVNSETSATTTTTQTTQRNVNVQTPGSEPPIATAHGGATAPMGSAASGSTDKPDVDTSALDAKIAQAERKAKASNASDADKRAAAAAYLERGNVFYNAGRPALYKFALRDLRKALRYEPDNAEAREKVDTIVSIYQSMNRPVPDLGNEP